MAYVTADSSKYFNAYETILSSTGSGWLFRSLGIGRPRDGAFYVSLNPNEISIALSHVGGRQGVEALKSRWETYFNEKEIEYKVESREDE